MYPLTHTVTFRPDLALISVLFRPICSFQGQFCAVSDEALCPVETVIRLV